MPNENNKFMSKVAEEQDLNPGEIIYLDMISQKKPSYRGLRYKEKMVFFQKDKIMIYLKGTPFNEDGNMKEKVKIICSDNKGENKALNKILQTILNKLISNLHHQAIHINFCVKACIFYTLLLNIQDDDTYGTK